MGKVKTEAKKPKQAESEIMREFMEAIGMAITKMDRVYKGESIKRGIANRKSRIEKGLPR